MVTTPRAREGKQILDDCRGFLSRFLDDPDRFPQGALFFQLKQQQFRVADDAGQYVVQVMGDAAGQQPQRLHFLGSG